MYEVINNKYLLFWQENMPSDDKSDDTSVSSQSGEKYQRSSRKSSTERRRSERIKNSTSSEFVGSVEQPLAYPGMDIIVNEDNSAGGENAKTNQQGTQGNSPVNNSGSNNQGDSSTYQGFDITTLIKQQLQLLQQLHAQHNAQNPATANTSASSTGHAPVQPAVNNDPHPNLDTTGQAGQVQNAAVPDEPDLGLANQLNLAFQVDPNMGPAVEASIAELIENCLNVPAATSRIEMQAMRDVYKRPSNCPSIGVPVVEKSILNSMSGAAQDRDKSMKFMQGWVMTALSAMGSIADDIKPYELDENCPWVRPIYAKMIDVIRILAHISVNEIG